RAEAERDAGPALVAHAFRGARAPELRAAVRPADQPGTRPPGPDPRLPVRPLDREVQRRRRAAHAGARVHEARAAAPGRRCRQAAAAGARRRGGLIPVWPGWVGSTHLTSSGGSAGSMSRLMATAWPSLRTSTHSSVSVALALISWCGT